MDLEFIHIDYSKIYEHIRKNQRLTKEFVEVLQRWKTNSKQDLFDAVLQKEKDLESWEITPEMSFPKEWKEPSFLIPNDEKNAEVINDILKKSWEIQTGDNLNLPGGHHGLRHPLLAKSAFVVHGFLKYYFDYLGILSTFPKI